jgi:hypothetical protein
MSEDINDLIDYILDRIHEEAPNKRCIDEDTIRYVLTDTLIGDSEGENDHARNWRRWNDRRITR